MTYYWAAICKGCGKEGAVRQSLTAGNKLDNPNPSEKINAECPLCKHKNRFSASDLREVPAYIVPSPPQSTE
jgi:hypothetical protein